MSPGDQLASATLSIRNLARKPLPTNPQHHLVVTTARGVYAWNCRGIVELFSSSSEGIVTARTIQTDKELLAVADSQVVILHDVEKGMQRTYRLKSGEQVYSSSFICKSHSLRRRAKFDKSSIIQKSKDCFLPQACKMQYRHSPCKILSY